MNKIKTSGLIIAMSLLTLFAQAQNNASTPPVDFMRSNGKIYVVMTVVLVILIGLFIYLFSIDRKLAKLEKQK